MKRWVNRLWHIRPRRLRRDDGQPLIIWDFDGTLADSLSVVARLMMELAPEYGIQPPTKAQIAAWRGMEIQDVLTELELGWWQVPGMLLRVQRGMKAEITDIPAVAGLEPVIRQLAGEYRFVMVSSNAHKNVKRWLVHQGWRRWFEFIVAGSSLTGKAAHFEKCIRKCGIPRERVVVVGDELRDVFAAKLCGIACVAVGWGFQNEAAFEKSGVHSLLAPEQLPNALRKALQGTL